MSAAEIDLARLAHARQAASPVQHKELATLHAAAERQDLLAKTVEPGMARDLEIGDRPLRLGRAVEVHADRGWSNFLQVLDVAFFEQIADHECPP
jgi:hypothetical protein